MEFAEIVSESDTPVPQGAGPEPAPSRLGPGEEKSDDDLLRELAALLFASPEPLSLGRLVELLERPARKRVTGALERLAQALDGSPLPVVLKEVAGSWRLLTDPEQAGVIARLREEPRPERISAAALETLAIIAYRQPVTKAEIEAIRGVQAGPVLRSLVDRNLVRVTGRAELPGAPLLYGTTREFLERFGLASLEELPRDGELNED
jgi:segregation and condensation protein B